MWPDDQPHPLPATSNPTRVFVILRVTAPFGSTYNHLCDITAFPAIKLAFFCLEGWFQSLRTSLSLASAQRSPFNAALGTMAPICDMKALQSLWCRQSSTYSRPQHRCHVYKHMTQTNNWTVIYDVFMRDLSTHIFNTISNLISYTEGVPHVIDVFSGSGLSHVVIWKSTSHSQALSCLFLALPVQFSTKSLQSLCELVP